MTRRLPEGICEVLRNPLQWITGIAKSIIAKSIVAKFIIAKSVFYYSRKAHVLIAQTILRLVAGRDYNLTLFF